jgi:glycosyltransferase involved in cell wall biosynthesis
MMRVALLAPANTVHTIRWANGLVRRGLQVHLLTAHDPDATLEPDVHVHRLRSSAPLAYVLSARELVAWLDRTAPDLLNAHYASGYGLLARLSRFKPLLLSMWGMDVYDFPAKSPLHRWLLRGNLQAATALASTSDCMARRAARTFDHPRVFVTPFGVDEQRFAPAPDVRPPGRIVVGTVKALTPKYGIDVLLHAFALARQRVGACIDLRLEITGTGPSRRTLERLAQDLGLADRTVFHGAVPHERVPDMLHRLDIFMALSRDDSESFGVAAVEAAACGKAIVVSDVDGLAEVIRHGHTGIVVRRDDPAAAADALCRLAGDAGLRHSLGQAAREHVLHHYTWQKSLDLMIEAYRSVVETHRRG